MPISAIATPARKPYLCPHPHLFQSLTVPHSLIKISFLSQFSVFSGSSCRFRQFRQFRRGTGWAQWRTGTFLSGEEVDKDLVRDGPGYTSLDALLSVAEILCIAPPVVFSIGCIVRLMIPGVWKPFQVSLGSRVFVLQFVLLVGAAVIGALIRERRWSRVHGDKWSGIDLIPRIEKVEEDLKSSVTIVRVLSRQLEKLGIRFRVTRKSLKGPITETAALAHQNSEATRQLAIQEDILEKELREIQKVLLAMQDQQQKQLELILAIGKAGRLLENKREIGKASRQTSLELDESVQEKREAEHLEAQTGLGSTNDKA